MAVPKHTVRWHYVTNISHPEVMTILFSVKAPVNWIKGRVRARGARGQHWYNGRRTDLAKKHARTQALWYLHLAGDWSEAYETEASALRPHMMRCMLVTTATERVRLSPMREDGPMASA